MAEQEAAFHAQFQASEAALTAQASIDALEKLSELLAVKGGMAGYRMRKEMFKRRALDEINSTPVSQIVSDSELIGSCRRSARELTAAVNGSDFKTAFEMAQKLRFNLEVLRHKAAARKVVSQTENLLKKARHAKKGIIYGDHQDALLDLSVRFGFTRPGKAYTHTVASVIREYNEQAADPSHGRIFHGISPNSADVILKKSSWLLKKTHFRDMLRDNERIFHDGHASERPYDRKETGYETDRISELSAGGTQRLGTYTGKLPDGSGGEHHPAARCPVNKIRRKT